MILAFGSAAEAGPRSLGRDAAMAACLADTSGWGGRRWGRVAEGRIRSSMRMASSDIVARSAGDDAVTVPTSRTRKGVNSAEACSSRAAAATRRGHDVDPDGGEVLTRRVANIPQRWTGQPWVIAPFSCPEPFPFYVARIDDRLL